MAATAGFLSPQTPQTTRTRTIPDVNGSSYESDQPLASSPLLREYLTPQNQLLSSDRSSRISSARLSRDLASWRQSLALSAAGTEFEDETEDEDGADRTMPQGQRSSQDTVHDIIHRSENGKRVETEDSSYSSQQLDDILASAREQLSLLEGRVKGARYSLADMPPLASYSPPSSTSSPIKATHGRVSAAEDSTRLNRSPRINFGAPRTNSSFSTTRERTNARHARNFSDTSVPSPQGQVPKGSATAQPTPQRDVDNRLSLREPSYRNARPISTLDPVVEESTSPPKVTHPTFETDSKRSSQLLDLRKDADNVRNRLSLIHDGVHSAVEKRSSWRDGPASLRPEDAKRIEEVQQLERLLKRQENLLGQLEQPEKVGDGDENENGQTPSEWDEIKQQHLYGDRSFQDLTDEDDLDSGSDIDYKSAMEEALLEGELEPDFDESHEDRADAFDYEHFIIHSVLNTANLQTPRSRSSSSASTASASTPRGPSGDADGDRSPAEGESSSREFDELQHSNHSTSTFATANSFVDMSDSDSDPGAEEEQTSDDERDLLTANGVWPMPPTAANSRPASGSQPKVTSAATQSESGPRFSSGGGLQTTGARPASLIYSALVDPLAGGAQVSEDDETLIRSLAESMRFACKELQRRRYDSARADDWRYRLEEARRLLSGESEIF